MSGRTFDILALDIDGVLLDTAGRLSKPNADAVRAARVAGVMVLFATARPPMTAITLAEKLSLDRPTPRAAGADLWPAISINYNGAVVWSFTARRAIMHDALDPTIASSVIAAARSIDPSVLVSLEHLDRWYTDCAQADRRGRLIAGVEPHFVGPLPSIKHIAPSRLTLVTDPDQLTPVRRLLMDEYAAPGLIACRSTGDDRLEVQAPHVDKASALDRIAQSLGVERKRICAVGDGPNDAGLLRYAGLGLAVANAWGEARTAADQLLSADSDHNPVAEAIERFILPQ